MLSVVSGQNQLFRPCLTSDWSHWSEAPPFCPCTVDRSKGELKQEDVASSGGIRTSPSVSSLFSLRALVFLQPEATLPHLAPLRPPLAVTSPPMERTFSPLCSLKISLPLSLFTLSSESGRQRFLLLFFCSCFSPPPRQAPFITPLLLSPHMVVTF